MPAGLFLSTFLNSVFPFLQCALTEIQLVLLSGSDLASSGSLVELAGAVSSLPWSQLLDSSYTDCPCCMAGPDDLKKSLPTSTILRFCETQRCHHWLRKSICHKF